MYILVLSLFIVTIDQIAKFLVRENFDQQSSYELIPGIIELTFSKNTGIAFSLFNSQPLLLTIIVTVINIALIYYVFFHSSENNISFGFIIGGALSNLIDRYIFGYVTDFINPVFVDFAIFNLADASLNIGAFLLIISLWKKSE